MTVTEFFTAYWPWIVVALGVLILGGALLHRSRGQRVSLSDHDSSTRTLQRPVSPPAAASAPQLADSELTRLKGVGPKLAAALTAEGINSLGDLAALDEGRQAEVDDRLGTFKGRLQRDRLCEQARLLTSDTTAYEATFGKGTA